MGGGEIILILLFVLVFFGSDKIPEIARTMGRAIRQVKDATNDIQRDIHNSANRIKEDLDPENELNNKGENKKP